MINKKPDELKNMIPGLSVTSSKILGQPVQARYSFIYIS